MSTSTYSSTYSVADIEAVMRRVTADLVMIAQSTGCITEETAREYGHDIELLAKFGYLKKVDVTLFSGIAEIRAATYEPSTDASGLSSSRPGGVRWPKMENSRLQLTLSYNSSYTQEAREKLRSKMKVGWVPSSADTSHAALKQSAARDYASNDYGVTRKDFG